MDIILAACGVVLTLALLPSFKRGNQPSVWTSAFCAAGLYVMATTYLVAGLTLAGIVSLTSAVLWTALLRLKTSL